MDTLLVMEWITILVTLFMFMTGLPGCLDMYKTGDTKNVPYIIFLLSAISCIGMLHYGLMQQNGTLIFLNGVGAFLNVLYVIMYIAAVQSKSRSVLYLGLSGVYFAALYYWLYQHVIHPPDVEDLIGNSAGIITAIVFTMPITEVIDNFQNKNADGIPLVMILGMLACGASWLTYGLMLNDVNIYAPNIPGLFVSIAKLYAIQLYGSSEKPKQQ
eukprot:GHVU01231917.1.p1 GENE.GHVU01231917.1~~GHVU01231917.1.p1  ORF type:complete len:214 (-),score=5.75 GHVU01231917.1:267-908(-)